VPKEPVETSTDPLAVSAVWPKTMVFGSGNLQGLFLSTT
jgi:hypothetical protein